jgi:hypothetical protein
VLGAFLASLFVLLTLTRVLYGAGGWLPIAIAAICFAVVVLFGPVVLYAVRRAGVLPEPVSRHRTVLALAADTAGLGVLLVVVFAVSGEWRLLATQALPIAGLAVVFVWVSALVIRYVPLAGGYRAAIVVAFVPLYSYVVFNPLVDRIVDDRRDSPVDLTRWDAAHIDGNVWLLMILTGLLAAAVLAAAQALRPRR